MAWFIPLTQPRHQLWVEISSHQREIVILHTMWWMFTARGTSESSDKQMATLHLTERQ